MGTAKPLDARSLAGIYLNDHQAAAVGAIRLARRSAAANAGTALGDFLSTFVEELETDLGTLNGIRRAVGARPNPVKVAAVRAVALAGQLKHNGRLRSYSPLSRVHEIETLRSGVQGKMLLWRTVGEPGAHFPGAAGIDTDALLARAEAQAAGLDHHHGEAVQRMLATGAGGGD